MIWHILIVIGILLSAFWAVRTHRLIVSALCLAGTSALVALMMYLLGAPEIAVIELSVGAGLVTVLFVFAISIAGEESIDPNGILPRPLAWATVLISFLALAWFILPELNLPIPVPHPATFLSTFWSDRKLDVLLQILLIFTGTLGMLGLLSEPHPHKHEENKSS